MSHVESWHATRRSRPSFQLAISRAEFKSYGRPPMPGETGRHEPCGRQLRLESNILNCLRTAMRTATAKCTESNARKRLGWRVLEAAILFAGFGGNGFLPIHAGTLCW